MVSNKLKIIIRSIAPIFKFIPQNIIIFESIPDFSDNSRSVFDEMIKRGFNLKYKMVWIYCQHMKTSAIPNVLFLTKKQRILTLYYMLRAKCIISCNNYVESWGEYQKALYLTHGVALKSMNVFVAPKHIDYIAGLSEEANRIMSKAIKQPIDKFIETGYPRNDSLMNTTFSIHNFFNNKYKKIVVWYPTFRQHIGSNKVVGNVQPLPIIHHQEDAVAINDYAKEKNLLIILKPHFSQDLTYMKDVTLSNILFINDDFFVKNKVTSYEFVGSCDALITDYSSIYFDYLLCDKPIAAVWEDIEEYKRNRGFGIDIDFYMSGAYKVYNLNDFLSFITDVTEGIDSLKQERNRINKLINKYNDAFSSKRTVDFIEENCLN